LWPSRSLAPVSLPREATPSPTWHVNTWDWQQSINNDGVVAAYANNTANRNVFAGDTSFLWKNGKITPLPGLLGATDTVAFSLNNEGQVVGRSILGVDNHAVLWDHGGIQRLGELAGDTGDNRSAALKINDRGQAVGYSRNSTAGTRHAVLWYKGTIAHQLPALPNGGNLDQALGINEKGQIVGFSGPARGPEHPALWAEGAEGNPIDLGSLGGASGDAFAINNEGQVVGTSDTSVSGKRHPFFWEDGVMSDLGVLTGDLVGVAYSINERGQVVGSSGSSSNPTDFTTHAFLWENGVMTDLQTRIPANSGWKLVVAGGINNRGQIDGYGIHNGNYRAFLLTPDHDE
jgi:probable HAF family extracellular repeat protein